MSDFTADARALAQSFQPAKHAAAFVIVHPDGALEYTTHATREDGLFEAGSVTKTITAFVLAKFVTEGAVNLNATVEHVLGGRAGNASRITMAELATHTSGLPRLPPGSLRPPFWPRDPYAFFTRRRLIRSLGRVSIGHQEFLYSNFGFSLLGRCLEQIGRERLSSLVRTMVFEPLGMRTARCQPCRRRGLERGRGDFLTGGRRWHNPNPGAGGIDLSISDLGAWLHANAFPEQTPFEDAFRLAHTVRHRAGQAISLAWLHTDGIVWHNGATGSFRSMAAFHPGRGAMGSLIASTRPGSGVDEQILQIIGSA